MSKLYKAFISVDVLRDAIKTNHSSVYTNESDGKQYISVDIWLNDSESQYGTIGNINLSRAKDDESKPIKLANIKPIKKKEDLQELPTPAEKVFNNGGELPF